MSSNEAAAEQSLRIVHVLRSPVGGLFRHVVDLAQAQVERGHAVGLIADSSTGGAHAARILDGLRPSLALGVTRLPMRRDPHVTDLAALVRVGRALAGVRPDVVHGHGAKGALYARLFGLLPVACRNALRVYTPHGGSLHHDRSSLKGAAVLGVERLLDRRTDLLLFESAYAADRYRAVIGPPHSLVRVVHNGLRPLEFVPVLPAATAADVVYVGEMRALKGVDLLVDALASLSTRLGRSVSAVLVGSGPDRLRFEARAEALGLADAIAFKDPMPARDAFALGRVLAVPSRAESLPYIVLEAAAAEVPMVATRVGGIPEIFGAAADRLVRPDDVGALEAALAAQLAMAEPQRAQLASALRALVTARFALGRMADGVLAGYREALAARHQDTPSPRHTPTPHRPRYGL